jgi:hypothetical protein
MLHHRGGTGIHGMPALISGRPAATSPATFTTFPIFKLDPHHTTEPVAQLLRTERQAR